MSDKCRYCVNKSECKNCDKDWKDKFIPSNEVRQYFHYGFVGVRGINGFMWHFDNTREDLKPTHSIKIGFGIYCPYCAEKMNPIQDADTLETIGYCCICEGARAELEYEKKKEALEEEYKRKQQKLQSEYENVLSFKTKELLEVKQRQETDNLSDRTVAHFSTLNNEPYTDIRQLID